MEQEFMRNYELLASELVQQYASVREELESELEDLDRTTRDISEYLGTEQVLKLTHSPDEIDSFVERANRRFQNMVDVIQAALTILQMSEQKRMLICDQQNQLPESVQEPLQEIQRLLQNQQDAHLLLQSTATDSLYAPVSEQAIALAEAHEALQQKLTDIFKTRRQSIH